MIIKEVRRSYSRTINTKSYGGADSYIKNEASYVAEIESGDDPLKVSEMLAEQVQKDVSDRVAAIVEKVKAANPGSVPATMAQAAAPINNGPRAL